MTYMPTYTVLKDSVEQLQDDNRQLNCISLIIYTSLPSITFCKLNIYHPFSKMNIAEAPSVVIFQALSCGVIFTLLYTSVLTHFYKLLLAKYSVEPCYL